MTDVPSQPEVLQGISDGWKNRDAPEAKPDPAPVQDDMSEPEEVAPVQAKAAPRAKVVKTTG